MLCQTVNLFFLGRQEVEEMAEKRKEKRFADWRLVSFHLACPLCPPSFHGGDGVDDCNCECYDETLWVMIPYPSTMLPANQTDQHQLTRRYWSRPFASARSSAVIVERATLSSVLPSISRHFGIQAALIKSSFEHSARFRPSIMLMACHHGDFAMISVAGLGGCRRSFSSMRVWLCRTTIDIRLRMSASSRSERCRRTLGVRRSSSQLSVKAAETSYPTTTAS